jgi:hypothetical protein
VSIPEYAEHLLGFLAPAFVLALLVALAAPLVLPRNPARPSWWFMAGLNFVAGAAVLAGGLWLFGRDGKMATYVALVIAVGTCQWLVGRGWRS